eukprot:Blabericola_migrator_1__13050@NODE_879_length_6197_cov_56_342251_g551_i2_p5_GENE_NODE_879_length_6197_cov_56_342251_g551_i2NODE_879_length_6197_cov_56_342251_g551_i2_p5_ORF_typecomplete_len119_score8_30DUF2505/PF10698_9/0_043_NODE_879_length_6197_cov_56_342251_g551_i230473403
MNTWGLRRTRALSISSCQVTHSEFTLARGPHQHCKWVSHPVTRLKSLESCWRRKRRVLALTAPKPSEPHSGTSITTHMIPLRTSGTALLEPSGKHVTSATRMTCRVMSGSHRSAARKF